MPQIKPNSPRQANEWADNRLAPLVKQIVTECSQLQNTGWVGDFVMTSIYRTPAEDIALGGTGIHPAWRAVDIASNTELQAAVDAIAAFANGKWVYDPARPEMKVCFTDPHGTGPHLHFQVHPSTHLR